MIMMYINPLIYQANPVVSTVNEHFLIQSMLQNIIRIKDGK